MDAPADVLAAVDRAVPVLLDSGIRRGTDVPIALCLGGAAELVGRPYIWALAVGGEQGVIEMIEQLRAEIATSMVLLGAALFKRSRLTCSAEPKVPEPAHLPTRMEEDAIDD